MKPMYTDPNAAHYGKATVPVLVISAFLFPSQHVEPLYFKPARERDYGYFYGSPDTDPAYGSRIKISRLLRSEVLANDRRFLHCEIPSIAAGTDAEGRETAGTRKVVLLFDTRTCQWYAEV